MSDMNNAIPVSSSSALDEETARAEVYGLLAALYYAPPPAELMAQLRVAVTEAPAAGGFLEEPWREVVAAARALSDEAVAAEYDALFGGVGKPDVFVFGSHYLSGFLNEKPLAALRNDLAALGLARDETMPETEDHIAYLCEVMRYLIAGDEVEAAQPHATAEVLHHASAAVGTADVRCDCRASQGLVLCGSGWVHPGFCECRGAGLRYVGLSFS